MAHSVKGSRWAAGLVVMVLVSSCSTSGSTGNDPAGSASTSVARTSTTATTTATGGTGSTSKLPGGVIVFEANFTSGLELHAVDLDAGSDGRIGGDVSGTGARFSPDGRMLAYNHRDDPDAELSDVQVFDLTTNKARTIGPGGCPNWTLDGSALIVHRPGGMVRLALDGTADRIDGSRDECGLEIGPSRYVVWWQDEHLELLDHGKRRSLLEAPRCGIGPVDADSSHRRIAYTVACKDQNDPHIGLWKMDLESGATRRLMSANAYGAAWSPDDTWIATSVGVEVADGKYRHDLWIVCVDACRRKKLYQGGVNNPTWGPSA